MSQRMFRANPGRPGRLSANLGQTRQTLTDLLLADFGAKLYLNMLENRNVSTITSWFLPCWEEGDKW